MPHHIAPTRPRTSRHHHHVLACTSPAPLPSNVSMSSYVRDLKRLQKQTPLSYKLLLTLVVFSYSTPPNPNPSPSRCR